MEAKARQVTNRNLCPSDLLIALWIRTLYHACSAVGAFDGGGSQHAVSVFRSLRTVCTDPQRTLVSLWFLKAASSQLPLAGNLLLDDTFFSSRARRVVPNRYLAMLETRQLKGNTTSQRHNRWSRGGSAVLNMQPRL